MENIQPPQNGVVTEQPIQSIQETYRKTIFPTEIRCFSFPLTQELIENIIKLVSSDSVDTDILQIDDPAVEEIKNIVYEICQNLEEFKDESAARIPLILGSNILFQQIREHIPLHAYEFTPLVFTFVLNNDENPNFTYFADTRGAVQTPRHKVYNNLVGTSFGLKARMGEVIVTPGYVQRYHETNMSTQTQVLLNVLVGFTG